MMLTFGRKVTPEQRERFREAFERASCPHLDTVCVESSVTGEIVAKLCTQCDRQFAADWVWTPPAVVGSSLSYAGYERLHKGPIRAGGVSAFPALLGVPAREAVTRQLAACQCRQWPGAEPCAQIATQEDFLCDVCRDGCACFQVSDKPVVGHVEILGWK